MVGALAVATLAGTGMAQTNAAAVPAPVQKTWADSLTFKGDLRYRYENVQDDSKKDADDNTYTRERNRIRARLGAEAKCSDKLKAGVELSTGGTDPMSGNQTLGDGFAKKEMRLSLAYADYSFFGENPTELRAIAGKMKNPFLTMPDDLVWDSDLTPEGVALKGQIVRGFATLMANGGYLWVQERSDTDDLMLYAGQLAAKFQFVPEISLTAGASYYGFQNVEGYDVLDWESKNNAYGNSTTAGSVSGGTTNKAWSMEYIPVVYFAQLDLWVMSKPLALFVQELSNGEADKLNQGHLYGVSLGKAKNPKTWEIGYSYVELEKDATIGMFTDSDRWGGGTDGKGSRVYGKYQVMKNMQVAATYLFGEKKISDAAKTTDYDRLQVDLSVNF
jgi:hypothetical protein